ncbi:MAG: DUF533 domain-containing protein [Acidobacteria bacterium]|nr:DUF533 domain-containing protein [Acidobacteriota bacterium]
MNPEHIIGQLLGSFLGGKSRRSGAGGILDLALGGRRASRGLVTPGTLVTAAGLVWGALEAMQQGSGTSLPGTGVPAPSSNAGGTAVPRGVMATPPATVSGPPLVPPPIPGATPISPAAAPVLPVPPDLLPLVQLAVSAARADGELSDDETAMIRTRALDLGAQALVDGELTARRSLESITVAFVTPEQRHLAYALAYGIVHGESEVLPGERMYLTQLSRLLALSSDDVARLEAETLAGT